MPDRHWHSGSSAASICLQVPSNQVSEKHTLVKPGITRVFLLQVFHSTARAFPSSTVVAAPGYVFIGLGIQNAAGSSDAILCHQTIAEASFREFGIHKKPRIEPNTVHIEYEGIEIVRTPIFLGHAPKKLSDAVQALSCR